MTESIDKALKRHGFVLHAFVYMPDHIHLLVRSRKKDSKIERLLFGIKRPFSFRVKRNFADHASPLLKQLMIQGRPGKNVFRFWQAGLGYDRNLN